MHRSSSKHSSLDSSAFITLRHQLSSCTPCVVLRSGEAGIFLKPKSEFEDVSSVLEELARVAAPSTAESFRCP